MFDWFRRLPIPLAIVLVACLSGLTSQAEEPVRLRILSYNINHGEGVDSRTDLSRITTVIREAEPDVVALQEVDLGMARTGKIDQARLLGGRLQMEHAFGGNLEFLGGSFGNAVLSRFPITEHQNHRLPSPAGGEPRGALEATISLPDNGPSFRILSTQLDHRREDQNRLASADWLTRLADPPEAPPAILAGDLNAGPDSPTLQRLQARWTPTSTALLPTVPAHEPRAAFDHILIAPAHRWRVVEVQALNAPEASDHRPILLVIEWLPESPTDPAPGS